MSSDMNEAIDLSKPIEAAHEDGRIQPVTIRGGVDHVGDFSTDRVDGSDGIWLPDGKPWRVDMGHRRHLKGWRIRNVAQPSPASEVPAALVSRAIACLQEWVASTSDTKVRVDGVERSTWAEARAIVAELTPVDGDEREAKKCLATCGWVDDDASYDAALEVAREAIRRGRELERGEG